jgi:hypothetical protein
MPRPGAVGALDLGHREVELPVCPSPQCARPESKTALRASTLVDAAPGGSPSSARNGHSGYVTGSPLYTGKQTSMDTFCVCHTTLAARLEKCVF